MAILAGSGVGKSTMMGMIARNTSADINVIALIGERGREVLDFIERDLGEAGLKKSVVIVSTSDQPALLRIKGANTATAVAEYFRDGEDPMAHLGEIVDGGFAMGSNLPLFAQGETDGGEPTKVTTSDGETKVIPKKATFGTMSSGGLY